MYKPVMIKKTTDEKLMILCKKEYLRHHPEMKYARLSRDAMIDIICEHYLRTP